MLLKKEFTVLCGKNSYIYFFFFQSKQTTFPLSVKILMFG